MSGFFVPGRSLGTKGEQEEQVGVIFNFSLLPPFLPNNLVTNKMSKSKKVKSLSPPGSPAGENSLVPYGSHQNNGGGGGGPSMSDILTLFQAQTQSIESSFRMQNQQNNTVFQQAMQLILGLQKNTEQNRQEVIQLRRENEINFAEVDRRFDQLEKEIRNCSQNKDMGILMQDTLKRRSMVMLMACGHFTIPVYSDKVRRLINNPEDFPNYHVFINSEHIRSANPTNATDEEGRLRKKGNHVVILGDPRRPITLDRPGPEDWEATLQLLDSLNHLSVMKRATTTDLSQVDTQLKQLYKRIREEAGLYDFDEAELKVESQMLSWFRSRVLPNFVKDHPLVNKEISKYNEGTQRRAQFFLSTWDPDSVPFIVVPSVDSDWNFDYAAFEARFNRDTISRNHDIGPEVAIQHSLPSFNTLCMDPLFQDAQFWFSHASCQKMSHFIRGIFKSQELTTSIMPFISNLGVYQSTIDFTNTPYSIKAITEIKMQNRKPSFYYNARQFIEKFLFVLSRPSQGIWPNKETGLPFIFYAIDMTQMIDAESLDKMMFPPPSVVGETLTKGRRIYNQIVTDSSSESSGMALLDVSAEYFNRVCSTFQDTRNQAREKFNERLYNLASSCHYHLPELVQYISVYSSHLALEAPPPPLPPALDNFQDQDLIGSAEELMLAVVPYSNNHDEVYEDLNRMLMEDGGNLVSLLGSNVIDNDNDDNDDQNEVIEEEILEECEQDPIYADIIGARSPVAAPAAEIDQMIVNGTSPVQEEKEEEKIPEPEEAPKAQPPKRQTRKRAREEEEESSSIAQRRVKRQKTSSK